MFIRSSSLGTCLLQQIRPCAMVIQQTFSEPRTECRCRTRSKVLPMRRLFVRALTFNHSARRHVLRQTEGFLYRDRGNRGRASISVRRHVFAAATSCIATRTCPEQVPFSPRWCARTFPGCEGAAGRLALYLRTVQHSPRATSVRRKSRRLRSARATPRSRTRRIARLRVVHSRSCQVRTQIPASRGYAPQPDARPHTFLRRPITRQRARPRTLQSQRYRQTRVSPQKYSTVEAVSERIETSGGRQSARRAHHWNDVDYAALGHMKTTRTGTPIVSEMVSLHARGAQQGLSPLM